MPPKDLYGLAFLAFLAGCGGRSHEPAVEGPGVVAGSGGLGNAGGAAAGAGRGGTGGMEPTCSPNPRSGCVTSCASSLTSRATCSAGEWECPSGVFWADCPEDSCAKDDGDCCDLLTGDITTTACGEDEKRLACEGGASRIANNAACIPESLGITDCHDIEGQACELADQQCNNAGGCRFSCRCIGTDGGFVWHCVQPAC